MHGPGWACALLAVARLGFFAPVERAGAQSTQGEGPLGNDVFLPTSDRAARALAEGDEALTKSLGAKGPVARDPVDRTASFEAWRRALSESESGDCAPTSRGTEAVERAVMRRLRAADAEVAAAWRARFDPVAAAALASAGWDPVALARIEHGFPLTRAAARSALALSDLEHEAGDAHAAATWLERARAHADPKDRDLCAAIERRAAALPPAPREDPGEPWRSASRLEIETQVALTSSEPSRRGVQPGIALLRDGRACVQGADSLHVIGADGKARSVPLPGLAREFGWSWLPPFAEKGERWPLSPASEGQLIALVAGRAVGTRGNALLLVDAGSGATEPRLSWAYSDAGFHGDEAGARQLADVLGPGLWEFEPGPEILGGAVVVQARQWLAEGEERPTVDETVVHAWCLALELESGLPRWKRSIAIGASGKARLRGARGIARPAEPLAIGEGRVFAGTGIGAGVMLDVCDGRILASVKCRRAPEGSRAWNPCAPFFARTFEKGEETSLLWAPSDSDRLYFLRADASEEAGGPFVLPPREIGDEVETIGADREQVLALSEAGGRATLARLSPISGARADSVPLPLGEDFSGGGLASASRAIVASDRAVYLFDLSRELYLLDTERLPGREESPEGAIAARGDRVFVAGEQSLWILRAR